MARVWNPSRSLGNTIFCSALSRHSKGGKLPSNVLLRFSFLFIIPSLTFFSTKDRKFYHVDSEMNVNHSEGLMCGLLTWMRRHYRPTSNDVLRREHIFKSTESHSSSEMWTCLNTMVVFFNVFLKCNSSISSCSHCMLPFLFVSSQCTGKKMILIGREKLCPLAVSLPYYISVTKIQEGGHSRTKNRGKVQV